MTFDPYHFTEKYQLALATALEETPESGLRDFEQEWYFLNAHFQPLLMVGSGPSQQYFIDYLRSSVIGDNLRPFSQLEVFHWMIELITWSYFHPKGAIYESRLLEVVLINVSHKAGREFRVQLYHWQGNLLYPTWFGYYSIPGSWNLTKHRYLEPCVDLYGTGLALVGLHAKLSLLAPYLAMDFMHLAPAEQGDPLIDDYKSRFYITATCLMRAYADLFLATGVSSPLKSSEENRYSIILLTRYDSIRNLTFPNPTSLDLPDLYRSYSDYLEIPYDLVRRGVRCGNNNWTPVRARSSAESVERFIELTCKQLEEVYTCGLYGVTDKTPSRLRLHSSLSLRKEDLQKRRA
jgi:hypothetical protein